jgi:chemotaxis protein CheY-P-specific phosphatase CheC
MRAHPLRLTAEKILTEWAHMLVDEVRPSPELFTSDSNIYLAWADLKGVIDGSVSILAQDSFLTALAANLLGVDPDEVPSEAEKTDALREMANVIAGNFLTEAYGTDTIFDVIQPQVSEVAEEELNRFMGRKVVFSFLADDAPVALSFSMRSAG